MRAVHINIGFLHLRIPTAAPTKTEAPPEGKAAAKSSDAEAETAGHDDNADAMCEAVEVVWSNGNAHKDGTVPFDHREMIACQRQRAALLSKTLRMAFTDHASYPWTTRIHLYFLQSRNKTRSLQASPESFYRDKRRRSDRALPLPLLCGSIGLRKSHPALLLRRLRPGRRL